MGTGTPFLCFLLSCFSPPARCDMAVVYCVNDGLCQLPPHVTLTQLQYI